MRALPLRASRRSIPHRYHFPYLERARARSSMPARGAVSVCAATERMRGHSYLDQVLAFRFGDEGLEFGGGEGIDQSRFGDHKQEDLGAGKDGEFVRLIALPSVSLRPRHRIRVQRMITTQS